MKKTPSNYTVVTNELGITTIVLDKGDGFISYIPTDPSNSEYQVYLESLNDPDKL